MVDGISQKQSSLYTAQELEGRASSPIMFRDQKLKTYLEAAKQYFLAGNFKKAEECATKIIEFNRSVTTARPLFFDEAIFFLADIKRIQAMKNNDPKMMAEAKDLLVDRFGKLQNLEYGYQAKYCMEILKTAVLNKQIFKQDLLTPQEVKTYFEGATSKYNKYAAGFNDNFIALNAFLDFSNYLFLSGDLDASKKECLRVIALVKHFGGGDINDEQKGLIAPHVKSLDLIPSIHKIPVIGHYLIRDEQYEPSSLNFYEAKATMKIGDITAKKFDLDHTNESALTESLKHYEDALKIMEEIKTKSGADFYMGNTWEQRQTYFMLQLRLCEIHRTLSQFYASDKEVSKMHTEKALSYRDAIVSYYTQKNDDVVKDIYFALQ